MHGRSNDRMHHSQPFHTTMFDCSFVCLTSVKQFDACFSLPDVHHSNGSFEAKRVSSAGPSYVGFPFQTRELLVLFQINQWGLKMCFVFESDHFFQLCQQSSSTSFFSRVLFFSLTYCVCLIIGKFVLHSAYDRAYKYLRKNTPISKQHPPTYPNKHR